MSFGQDIALVSDAAWRRARARTDEPIKRQSRYAMRDERGRACISDADLAQRQDTEAFGLKTGYNITTGLK